LIYAITLLIKTIFFKKNFSRFDGTSEKNNLISDKAFVIFKKTLVEKTNVNKRFSAARFIRKKA